jgi:tellurite resistance protein/uncharacterized protein (DUF697 family)
MSSNQKEALAGLRILVCMAKADGKILAEEREALSDAMSALELPEGITIDSLLEEKTSLEDLMRQITTIEAQQAIYDSAYTMAYVDGKCSGSEQLLLDKLHNFFGFSAGHRAVLSNTVNGLKQVVNFSEIEKIVDDKEREEDIRKTILNYATSSAILGLNPIPGLSVVSSLTALGLTLKMMNEIGAKWGYPKGQDALAIIGNLFGGLGAFVASFTVYLVVGTLGLFIPGGGMVAAATSNFALTWAMGKATNQFYASGRQIDRVALKKVFEDAKKEGSTVYADNADVIAAKKKDIDGELNTLNNHVKYGIITPEEYQEKVQNLVS